MSGEPPAKRLPPSVYRRRRIVLLLVLIAIVAVVWVLIAQPWRGAAPAPEQTTDAAPEPSATPDPTATPTAKPCVSREVTVEALTDQDTYEAGQNPQLSITTIATVLQIPRHHYPAPAPTAA